MKRTTEAHDLDVEDLYDNAACGHIAAWPDGRIAGTNATLAKWLGYPPDALIGKGFAELLTVGGRIHYETHIAPMMHMNGRISGITVDFVTAGGDRLPAFITANVKVDDAGAPVLWRITAQDAQDRRSYERELLEARQRAEHERARVQVLATTLQRSLVPPSLSPPDGLDAVAYHRPASSDDVGGDFYDLFPLSKSRWAFFLGDVCGKGAEAAALTSLTRYALRAAAVEHDDPVAVLHTLDAVLHHEFRGKGHRFCTVLFGVILLRNNGFDVEVASGGHPPALILRADGTVGFVDTEGGQAVGMFADAHFTSTHARLFPGDTLLLYTDGLTEARTGDGAERYDDDGALLDFATAHAPTDARAIVAAFESMLGGFGTGLEDDVAILALGVPRGGAAPI